MNTSTATKLLLIVVSLAVLQGCSGDSSSSDTDVPNLAPIIEYQRVMYPQVTVPVSYADVTSLTFELPNEKYFYGDNSLQFVEHWRPSSVNAQENLPVIVFIHGGCWSRGFLIEQSYPLSTALAENGFPVWSIEYRATGDLGGGWPGTYQDIEAAITLIDDKRKELFSQRKLIVLGHSAGGHLALLASSNLSLNFDVVGLAAIVDIIDYANGNSGCNSAAVSFMNGTPASIPNQYALANPKLASLTGTAHLFVGGRDTIVPRSQALNSSLPNTVFGPAGHFDWIHPGTDAFSSLLEYLLTN